MQTSQRRCSGEAVHRPLEPSAQVDPALCRFLPSEDDVHRERHREDGPVLQPIDQQLELKDGEITD